MAQTNNIVPVTPNWDAALTYDSLDNPDPHPPVFVGRQLQLDPLVVAIAQPQKRGTYLISGYRGAGKTSLLIEALRRAKDELEQNETGTSTLHVQNETPWQLFPLVMNVSEVSASLRDNKPGEDATLHIDPRRLLIAMLRALKNRLDALNNLDSAASAVPDTIHKDVNTTYLKAMASEYSSEQVSSEERLKHTVTEHTTKLSVADVYKLIAGGALIGVVGLEGVALLGSGVATLHALSVALAGASVLSFAMSRKVTRELKAAEKQQTSFKFDNSLHQLETDLKDLLRRLYEQRLRCIVVLEELDKIEDVEGRQLDGVIRYFKNLFTQAPALFFFVTDKSYYDLISSKIHDARRHRSYAVEHTFFTNRVFVGRPTTSDCLDYLAQVVKDENFKQAIESIQSESAGRVKALGDMTRAETFVRTLLFRAANHIFDLKNDLRRYTRVAHADAPGELSTVLAFDERSFPDDEAAVAVFQACVEYKAKAFAFTGARSYANEVLHDCLYAVFRDLGTTHKQQVDSFYPRLYAPDETENATKVDGGSETHEELDASEAQRITDAVLSLIEDLQRGGAFNQEQTDLVDGNFVWRADAAQAFKFVRRLEKHEEDYVRELERMAKQTRLMAPNGPLGQVGGVGESAADLLKRLDNRAKESRNAEERLPIETVTTESRNLNEELTALTDTVYQRHIEKMQQHIGLWLPIEIGTSTRGGRVLGVFGIDGDPRMNYMTETGAILLAQGEGTTLLDDIRQFIADAPTLTRLSIIHVLPSGDDTKALNARKALWHQDLQRIKSWLAELALGGGMNKMEQTPPVPRQQEGLSVYVDVISLDEGWRDSDIQNWGRRLGELIVMRSYWAMMPGFWFGQPSTPMPIDFKSRIENWLDGKERLLWLQPDPDSLPDWAVVSLLPRVFNDSAFSVAPMIFADQNDFSGINQYGLTNRLSLDVNAPFSSLNELVLGWIRDGKFISVLPLVDIPGVATDPLSSTEYLEMIGERGRGIVISDEFPSELESLSKAKISWGEQ